MQPRLLVIGALLLAISLPLTTHPVAAGSGFATKLRVYTADSSEPHHEILRLQADEGFANYFWRIDPAEDAPVPVAAGQFQVFQLSTQNEVCGGPVLMAGTHVNSPCDDLLVLHFYELEFQVLQPGTTLTLFGFD